jgi:SAM-dependent methyltransferase
MADDIVSYYSQGVERDRVEGGYSRIEFARTKELLLRFLPSAPARVLDVGGGPGAYASWLAGLGYHVRLVDPVPLHVEQARARSEEGSGFEVALGDARRLDDPNASRDAVLLFGPLYHLVHRDDRLQALSEARRVTRPGGVVAVSAISRFASLLDGLVNGYLGNPRFDRIVDQDLRTGVHKNPTGEIDFFTEAYFHRAEDLEVEVTEAGLSPQAVFGIEGPGWLLWRLWDEPDGRERILRAARAVESERSVLETSGHLLLIARNE